VTVSNEGPRRSRSRASPSAAATPPTSTSSTTPRSHSHRASRGTITIEFAPTARIQGSDDRRGERRPRRVDRLGVAHGQRDRGGHQPRTDRRRRPLHSDSGRDALGERSRVLANDYDPDGDGIIAALSSSPSNGTRSMVVDGSFTYTPDEDFVGTDSFTYGPGDSDSTLTRRRSLSSPPDPNRGPTAVDDHYTVVQGENALGERPRRPRERRRPGRRFDHRGAIVVTLERNPEHGRRRKLHPTRPTGTSSGPTRSPTRPGRPRRGRTVRHDHYPSPPRPEPRTDRGRRPLHGGPGRER